MNRIMDYDEWYAQNEDTINIELVVNRYLEKKAIVLIK